MRIEPIHQPGAAILTGVAEVTDALKRCLKSRGMTYATLARAVGLSEASVKRLFSSGGFTMKRIEQICRVLDIDLYELARLARSEAASVADLTLKQEQALAESPRLLLVFHLLLGDWRAKDIVAEYSVSHTECVRLMLELDRLRLIDLRPGDEVRLRTARHVNWRRDGPIRRAYQDKVLDEFFGVGFDRAGETLRFEAKELSQASREVLRRKLERLVQEFNELAEIDSGLKPEERDSVGLVIGMRPYVLSLFTRMKRSRPRAS
jgi:transcriptional regulator with XRE-family HTH domain